MSRKKKKIKTTQLLKQQEAENRKKFYNKVKWFFCICGHEELFKLIPQNILDNLRLLRFHAPISKIFGRLPQGIKNEKILNQAVYCILRSFKIQLPACENSINYYDYFTIGTCINLGILSTKDAEFDGHREIQEKMKAVNELFCKEKMKDKLIWIFAIVNFHFSSLNYSFYNTQINLSGFDAVDVNHPVVRLKFDIKEVYKTYPIEIQIGDGCRPVYKVGWIMNEKFKPAYLSPQMLHLNPSDYPAKIFVYIQNHAINRLEERIDLLPVGYVQFMAYTSILKHKIRKSTSNTYYIEFIMEGFKIGYMAADLIGKRLIIRTFLLSTQEGTPEVKKFKSITGLTRDDIDYLNMTKLSSFVDSGIEDNPRLKTIFKETGLYPIIECCNFIYQNNHDSVKISDRLLTYLNVEPEETNWDEVADSLEHEHEKETDSN